MTGNAFRLKWSRLLALVVKEWRQILLDPSFLVMGLGLPILMLWMYGYGISMDIKNIPIAVVAEEKTPLALDFADRFQANGYFDVSRCESLVEAQKLFAARKVEALVHVPAGFAADAARADARIGLTLYGVDANTALMIRNYITGTAQTVLADALRRGRIAATATAASGGAITVVSRLWFNEANDSTLYLVPGLLVIVTAVSAAFLGSQVIAKESERGTLAQLFVTPASSWEIILSKLAVCSGIAFCGFIVCLILSLILFDVPIRGSIAWLLATGAAFAVATATLGLMISARFKSQFLATECAVIASFMPTMMLSGFLFDLRSVPTFIALIGKCFPPSYVVESLRICFLSGGADATLAQNVLLLLAWTALMLAITFRLMSKQPKRSATAGKEKQS